MRNLALTFAMGTMFLLTGCSGSGSKWGFLRNSPDQPRITAEKPSSAQLVEYLNRNAQQIQSIECTDLDLDVKAGNQPFGMQAMMACRKGKNFRLKATAVGNLQADMGSNDQEFWYWIAKADPPYLVYCSYADLSRGVQLPFPFQPEWVMEALGMAEYDPAGNYALNVKGSNLELVQQSVSPQGQPVRKVTIFNNARDARVRVRAHLLLDDKGREICSAYINDVQIVGGVTVPTKVILTWPSQRMELKMKLNNSVVNHLEPVAADRLFTRPTLANVQSVDLARTQYGASSQLSPAGGPLPR
jgi:hypothetical protein